MKRLYRYVLLWVLLLLAAGPVAAQTLVFADDFESAADRAQWVRNKFYNPSLAVNLYNKWYLGKPGNFGEKGQYGLYISSDPDSARAVYSAPGENYTLAYRDIPNMQVGVNYTLQFAYRLKGSDGNAYCQVWWLPSNYPYLDADNGPVDIVDWQNAGGFQIGASLSNHMYWSTFQSTFSLGTNQVNGRLVFLWYCRQSSAAPPSACVDDIRIYDGTPCSAPGGVKYDAKKGTFTWTGMKTNQYEVTFFNTYTGVFEGTDTITGTSTQYVMSDEGYYIAYVRNLCGNGVVSPLVSYGSFVWIKGRRCIDYLDIGILNSNAGICYTGKHAGSESHSTLSFPTRAIVDHGFQDPTSMHTIHYDRSEVDPNSDGGLKTVPDNEIASVRLGANTDAGDDARIEYEYFVTPGQSDLMYLQYACVLNSGGHDEDNPFFQLDILDENGHQIEGCTHEYFVADMTGSGGKWHQNDKTWWSDWDQVAVSLRNYQNTRLKIRLTASRCVFDTHFGYAYFTISCASGDLEGINCGDFGTTQFEAPEGFDYRWYWAEDKDRTNPLSEERIFPCGATTDSIYMVDVISKSEAAIEERCSFTLTANPNPRMPRAGGMYTLESVDCTNRVTFIDTSYVVYVNRKDPSIVTRSENEFPDVTYYFSDGTETQLLEETLVHDFPSEGGIDTVKIVATMSQGECGDTAYIVLNLPDLRSSGFHRVQDQCDGEPFRLPSGEWVTSDTTYYNLRTNKYNCEYYDTLDVRFHDTFRDTTYQSICEHTSFTFEGQTFSKEGLDSVIVATEEGCDSVRYLNLHIIPDVHFAMETLAPFCDDQATFAIPVTVNTGKYAGAALVPDARAVAAGFKPRYEYPMEEPYSELAQPLDTVYEIPVDTFIRPGYYTFQLQSLYRECPVDAVPFNFTLYYSSKVLYQKDGYIVLYNPEYNYGGYEFSSYRWFRDGMPLSDTKSYIQPTDSDYQHIYQVELIPAGDSIGVMSCPMEYTGQFTPHKPMQNIRSSVSPSVVRTGEPLYVTGEGDARIYDALGRLVMTAPVDSENPVTIPAPQRGGMYVVLIQNDAYRVLVH